MENHEQDEPEEHAIPGTVELSAMPGCSGVVVSHRLRVNPAERGKGYGRALSISNVDRARALGYGLVLATVRTNNAASNRIHETTGWIRLGPPFVNPRTGHAVQVWARYLNSETQTENHNVGSIRSDTHNGSEQG